MRISLLGIVLLSGNLTGCQATCKEACEKLLECDEVETSRHNIDDCETSCQIEEELYNYWEDELTHDAFEDHLNCIVETSCSEVADGACYDEALFLY